MRVETAFGIHGGKNPCRRGSIRQTRPGYAEIKVASGLHPDSGAWAFFMREIVKLPRELTPAVSRAIRQTEWTLASDPLATVRSRALRVANTRRSATPAVSLISFLRNRFSRFSFGA